MKVTIGIKAYNEETHIARCLASALEAVAPFQGEVVLADSGSSDRTIEIARSFPVRIFQIANPAERSCGAGGQLAFQHAAGEFFYMLDGDMVLDADFVAAGIAYLEAHPGVAAVGGIVNECNVVGEEFQIRHAAVQKDRNWLPGPVDRLDCGGLYRTAALREVGYFADRNLHAFEEFELAARLQSKGWTLARIDHPAVDHYGHTTGGYQLLWRRVKSGYSGAAGEVLRGAIGRGHFGIVLGRLGHIRNGFAVMLWWAALIASLFAPRPLLWVTLLIATPLVFLMIRRGSARLGLFSLVFWNVGALGLLTGLFRPRVAPDRPIASTDLTLDPRRSGATG